MNTGQGGVQRGWKYMQLLNISGWDQKFFKFLIMIFAFDLGHKTCLLPLCVHTCRWAWSPRRVFSSDKPCWEVEGPRCLSGGACRWLGYYPIKQPPLFPWPLERSSRTVAETDLQCMYHIHIHIHTTTSPNTTPRFFCCCCCCCCCCLFFYTMSLATMWPRWTVTKWNLWLGYQVIIVLCPWVSFAPAW